MSLTPRQLHGAVGSVLTTAAENGWLRTKSSDRFDASNVRFIMFPVLQAADSVQVTPEIIENVEIAQKISMRIGRYGVRGWSLTAIETHSVTYVDKVPPQPLVFAGRETAFETINRSETPPAVTHRVVSKINWHKEGVDRSIRSGRMICDELPEYMNDIASEIDALDHYDADMIPHEMDRVSLSEKDILALFNTAHTHAQQVMLSPEEKARQWSLRWINGNESPPPNSQQV